MERNDDEEKENMGQYSRSYIKNTLINHPNMKVVL